MSYVDGFVIPVRDVAGYRKLARMAGKIWMEHGALQYVECVADDVPDGKRTDFRRAVKLKEGETVVFAFIVYKTRAHRDKVLKAVMADPRMTPPDPRTMPFDMTRMILGGFRTIVEA